MEEKDITLSVAEKMLSYVDSTDREIWYKMAAALKNHFGEDGRGLYHKWSAKAENYNERAADSQFNSARYGSNNIWFLKNRATERGWQPDKTYQPTAAEIEQQQQKLAQAEKKRQKEERERAKKQANASRKAKWVWENRTKSANPKHPYLVKKGISDPAVLQHIRQSGDNLIIPLKQGKEVVGMQMIFPNGRKHIPADTPKKGSALFLGDTHLDNLKQGFYMAEGFATSASIVSATGRPCLMCIDGGNLPTVALTIKEMVNKHQISVWVAADINDGSVQNPNVGVKHAKEVVEILGETAQFITPDFSDDEVREWKTTHDNKPPTDFNDLQSIGGVERVKNALANTFRQPEQSVLKENQMTEKELLLQMLDSQDIELRKNAATNAMADDEVLHKAFLDEEDEVRRAAILNPNASDKFLSKIFDKANPIEKSLMIHHAHIDAHTLKMAIEDGSSDMFVIANHHNANEFVLEKLLREVAQENVKTTAAKRLQNEYGWREEQFLALEQKETQEYVSGSLNNFEQRQNEINQQKADLQNKLDELQKQQDTLDTLQVQLTAEQLAEIDKKVEEIYKQQAMLDQQESELHIERRKILQGISGSTNERENGIHFDDGDDLTVTQKVQAQSYWEQIPAQDKARAAFERLQSNYRLVGQFNPQTDTLSLTNGKNSEQLHFDPTQERIVLTGVNPQTKRREEIADTHLKDLSPKFAAHAIYQDYQAYQQHLAENEQKFPNEEQKKVIDKTGDTAEKKVRDAKSKTAKLTPPNAPPETISERYNAVERSFLDTKTNLRLTHRVDYVDSENGKTVLFSDKGSKLTTAKNDPQTVADMVEVAKAKGWTSLKLSGNKEFRRQAWLVAESQGIKTKGYKPSPQDLAMLEKMREKRSLNSVEQTKKQEKAPDRQPEHTPQAEKQVEKTPQKDLSGSPKQESTPETAESGILLEHGAARFQFDKDKPMSYYAMLQMPNGEKQVLWGKEIEKTLQEHNVQIGDRISLQKNGYENVRVQEPIKDKDGKTVLDENGNPKTEEVMRKRNHWDLAILDKAQEVPKEQEVKHDLMGQPERYGQENNHRELANSAKLRTRAIANADKISSLSAGLSEDGLVPTEVKTKADKLESAGNRVLANTTNHTKIQSTQVQKGSMPNGINVKARLTQARQTFKNKMSSLPDDERRKVLAYEKGAMDIWEKVADKDTQERLQVNFYTSISEKIQDGKTTLPPAMSNAAAKEALENRRMEREQEMTMGR